MLPLANHNICVATCLYSCLVRQYYASARTEACTIIFVAFKIIIIMKCMKSL